MTTTKTNLVILLLLTAIAGAIPANASEPLLDCRGTYMEYAGVARHRSKVKDAVLKALIIATPTLALAIPVGLATGIAGLAVGPWVGGMFGMTPAVLGTRQLTFKSSLEKGLDIVNWAQSNPSSVTYWSEAGFPDSLRSLHKTMYVARLKRDYADRPKAVRDDIIRQSKDELDSATEAELRRIVLQGLDDGTFCPKNKEPWNAKKLLKYVKAQVKNEGLLR